MFSTLASLSDFKKVLTSFEKRLREADESLFEEIAEYQLQTIRSELEDRIEGIKESSKEDY